VPRIEDYQDQPIQQVNVSWSSTADRASRSLRMDLAIHPCFSERIIINYPGYRGDIDGYQAKHRNLARFMQGEGLGAVVRGKGPGHPDFNGLTVDIQLRKMIDFSIKNSLRICGTVKPEIFLIGTSAGGSAVAAIAHEFSAVSRILLMAPSGDMEPRALHYGLGQFSGEVYILMGLQDRVVGGERTARSFYNMAARSRKREVFLLDYCDHHFSGTPNGRIMSQAPFYAFARGDRPNFPDPEGGMVLY